MTQVWKSPIYSSSSGALHSQSLFYIAQAFSASTDYDIIDSSVNRNADPIFNSNWTVPGDVSGLNSWIVVQQTVSATIPEKWQAKFQCADAGNLFDDPSGNDYAHEGDQTGLLCIRFAPHGGWNGTSIDFDTPTTVSLNRAPFWGAPLNEQVMMLVVTDAESAIIFGRIAQDDWQFHNVMALCGTYAWKTLAQQPLARWLICQDEPGGANSPMSPNYFGSGGFTPQDVQSTDGVGFLDETGQWLQSHYRVNNPTSMINPYSQPNQFDTPVSLDLYPMLVRGVTEWNGMLGEAPLVSRMSGIGHGQLFDNKGWLCLADGDGIAVRWDSSTDPR